MNTPEIVFGYLGGVAILGAFIWIGVALHMAYTKMDELLDPLENCSAIMARAPLRHGGPQGKLLLIGGISGIVTFPGCYLKRGELSTEDLKIFPCHLNESWHGSSGASSPALSSPRQGPGSADRTGREIFSRASSLLQGKR